MKSCKTTTRHYHLRQIASGKQVPVKQHPMNYWGVTALSLGMRKPGLIKSFTSPRKANSFKQNLIKQNKASKVGPVWKNPRVVKLKDSDKDGVPDVSDCAPNDPNRQGVIHSLSKASKYIKKLTTKEKERLQENFKKIDKIIHERKHKGTLTANEQTKILGVTDTFKKEHPLVTASIKGMILGGEAALIVGLGGGTIRLLLRPRTIAYIGRIALPRVSPIFASPPVELLKEKLFKKPKAKTDQGLINPCPATVRER